MLDINRNESETKKPGSFPMWQHFSTGFAITRATRMYNKNGRTSSDTKILILFITVFQALLYHQM